MTNRTVKILGWGTGNSPAAITAILDGVTIFSGEVNLVEMAPDNESSLTAPTLFTFEIPLDFSGTKHLAISVDKAEIRFGQVVANYTEIVDGEIKYSTGADEFSDIAVADENGIFDPRSNVLINGIKQEADRSIGKGTWHWYVYPGAIFTHDLNIPAGSEE